MKDPNFTDWLVNDEQRQKIREAIEGIKSTDSTDWSLEILLALAVLFLTVAVGWVIAW